MKSLQGTTQALTRGSQRLRLTVNVQIGLPGSILQGFIKPRDQICELNYRGTKPEIGDKVEDQFCNFAKKLRENNNFTLGCRDFNFFFVYLGGF